LAQEIAFRMLLDGLDKGSVHLLLVGLSLIGDGVLLKVKKLRNAQLFKVLTFFSAKMSPSAFFLSFFSSVRLK
jgi:hypothetical protein